MKFPKYSCQKIVHEINKTINEQVNMMDHKGMIIASTDASRIGTFHEGAKRVIDEKLDMLIIRSDEEYAGARPGINLPVEFRGDIVGVIGVTGPEETVGVYGKIIKKMTEILLMDISMRTEVETEQRVRTRFLTDWIHSSPEGINEQMAENGLQNGIDIKTPRRVMLMSIIALQDFASVALQRGIDAMERNIQKQIRALKDAFTFKLGSVLVCCIGMADDQQMLGIAGAIKTENEQSRELTVCIGIDDAQSDYTRINTAYRHAQKALRTCVRSLNKKPRIYQNINMEIFSGEIPDTVKLEYVRRIFRNYAMDEIPKWITLLDTYYACDGSLAQAAEKLFIHKNTLQYRLRQLQEKTGYDPRGLRDSSLFYNAIHFYHDIRDNNRLEWDERKSGQ